MDKERKSPYRTETIGYTFSVSYLAKAEAINAQFQLGQKLGLTSEEEKEIFNLYLAERLLENEVHLAIAGQNNLRFPRKSEPLSFLAEGISRLEEKTKELKEQVDPERAWTIYAAVEDLNTQIKNENPENTSTSFRPTKEILLPWKDKWAPQLASKNNYCLI